MPLVSNSTALINVVVDDVVDLTNVAVVPIPVVGQMGYVVNTDEWYYFDGLVWQLFGGGGGGITRVANTAALPGAPTDNQLVQVTADDALLKWDAVTGQWVRVRLGQQGTFVNGPLYQCPPVIGQDINVLAAGNVVQWQNGAPFVISSETGLINATQFQIFAGVQADYLRVNIMLRITGAVARWNGVMRIRRAGLIVPISAANAYIRNASGHNEASLHLQYDLGLAPGPVCQIEIDRESAGAGPITIVDGLMELEVVG